MFKCRDKWQFRLVSIILSLVIQVLLASIIVTLYFMHSFITILKVLISTMTSFSWTEHWEQWTAGGLAWDEEPVHSLQTINTIEEREDQPQHNHTEQKHLNNITHHNNKILNLYIMNILFVWRIWSRINNTSDLGWRVRLWSVSLSRVFVILNFPSPLSLTAPG